MGREVDRLFAEHSQHAEVAPGDRARRAARIAFVSPTGYGNLGDAAIIESLIYGIRRRQPDAEIFGFTQNPSDTTARHCVPAFTCTGLTIRGYKVREGSPSSSEPEDSPGPSRSLARRALVLLPGLRRGYHLLRQIAAERRHRRISLLRLRGCDLVVVAGGGQLDDFWGGAFGHPYTLWRWASLARRVRARFVVLSVGTGHLSPLSARFVHRALVAADYRSYRDDLSRRLVGAPHLTADDPIVPDLAYAWPVRAGTQRSPRPAVGVSPMVYADPRVWPAPDLARYRRHVGALAALSVRIVRAGHEVVLFTSDGPDRMPLAEMRELIEAKLRPEERARVRCPGVAGVEALMRVLADCEVVISARLHGVLLSHLAGRPTLAFSHERKVRTLMEEMELGRYCFEMDDFGPEDAWERFLELYEHRDEIADAIARKVAALRRRVDAQFDLVFGGPP